MSVLKLLLFYSIPSFSVSGVHFILGLYQIRIVVSTIQPNKNSSTNKQMHGCAYFDKYYVLPTLKLIVFVHVVNKRLFS